MPGPIRDEWLPSPIDLQSWFDMMRNTLKRQPPFFNSVTADFEKFAVGNAVIYQQLNEMIDQASSPKACILCTHVLTYSHQWTDSRRTLKKCSSCLT